MLQGNDAKSRARALHMLGLGRTMVQCYISVCDTHGTANLLSKSFLVAAVLESSFVSLFAEMNDPDDARVAQARDHFSTLVGELNQKGSFLDVNSSVARAA